MNFVGCLVKNEEHWLVCPGSDILLVAHDEKFFIAMNGLVWQAWKESKPERFYIRRLADKKEIADVLAFVESMKNA